MYLVVKKLTVGDYGIPMESFINLLRIPTAIKGFRALDPNAFVLTICRKAVERFWVLVAERNIL